jgi:hypothetical protein
MKKILLLLSLITGISLQAQDTIVTTSGEIIPALVKNITATEVEYKKQNNPEGPTYIRSKSEVLAIHYKNGTTDTFSKKSGGDDYYAPASAKGNSTAKTMSDVITTSYVVFYGIDFTNFSLVEPKRKSESEKIKNEYFSEWNRLFVAEVPPKTMSRWLKKFDLSYNIDAAIKLNQTAKIDNIVSAVPPSQDMREKIKTTVAAYAEGDTRTSGIGMVINVEYFYKAKQETSLYVTWFDIATHAVISSERVVVRQVQSGGLTKFWLAGLVEGTREYIDKVYKKY